MKNTPYKVELQNGIVSNPIEKAFLNEFPNRRIRRNEFKQRKRNNTQGKIVIVTKIGALSFTRYVGYNQVVRTYSIRGEHVKTIQHLKSV